MPFAKRKKITCRKNSDLKPKECCAHVVAALDRHLTIPIQGKPTQSDLFTALVSMAAMNQSVQSITSIIDRVPCETSFRYHLKKLHRDELERNNTAILTSLMQYVLIPKKAYQFAIDLNDRYYGRPRARMNPTSCEADAKSRQMSFIPTSSSV
jgi:putative transposase